MRFIVDDRPGNSVQIDGFTCFRYSDKKWLKSDRAHSWIGARGAAQ
jgi:hypothetical protein